MGKKIRERHILIDEIKKRNKIAILHNNAITVEMLEEYKKDRPLMEKYTVMEKRFHNRDVDSENLDS